MNTRPALCLLCSLGGIASPLLAAPDPLAHLSDHFAPELADGELAHLRGRLQMLVEQLPETETTL